MQSFAAPVVFSASPANIIDVYGPRLKAYGDSYLVAAKPSSHMTKSCSVNPIRFVCEIA